MRFCIMTRQCSLDQCATSFFALSGAWRREVTDPEGSGGPNLKRRALSRLCISVKIYIDIAEEKSPLTGAFPLFLLIKIQVFLHISILSNGVEFSFC